MLDPDLVGHLSEFVSRVRPVLEKSASPDDLFLMTDGSAMTDSKVSAGYRSIWRAAGLSDPTFKTEANSRHIRHTATGLARTLGTRGLKQNVHIALNHSERTNESSYLSSVRSHLTVEARAEVLELRRQKSSEFDSMVNGGRVSVSAGGQKSCESSGEAVPVSSQATGRESFRVVALRRENADRVSGKGAVCHKSSEFDSIVWNIGKRVPVSTGRVLRGRNL